MPGPRQVALLRWRIQCSPSTCSPRAWSHGAREFGEAGSDPGGGRGLDAKLVVSSTKVLDEGMTGDDYRRSSVGLQAPHRPKPRLEASVVGLDAVVGAPLDVVEGTGEELVHDPDVARRLVGDDLDGQRLRGREGRRKEATGRS